jgi:aminocarboxymuconate-semialdehyde decarboxylase
MIDVHAHVVLEGVLGCAGAYGPELTEGADGVTRFRAGDFVLEGVKYRDSPFMDVNRRLALNDHLGIQLQVLSPNPITYFHHIEATTAVEFCRWHNSEMVDIVARHPDRLAGFAQLPMQDVAAAVAELHRATDRGLLGAYIGTDFGMTFDDERLDPLWAAAISCDVPIFVHPAPAGIDGPLRDERIRRFDLDLSLGFIYEETLAVACVIYGGVIDRHPGLDLCFSHGGGAAAFMSGRLQHQGRSRPWAREHPVDFASGLRRLWFDQHVHDTDALDLVTAKVGVDRLVVGTNLAGWDAPHEPGEIPYRGEYDVNARRLLRLPPMAS